jgi:hypothetical protein
MRVAVPVWVKALVFMAGIAAHGVAAPIISVQPSSSTILLGQTSLVNVAIAGVSDLYAFQFDVVFDGSILAAATVTEGSMLPSGGATFFIAGSINNAAGRITGVADTLIGPITGVNGMGVLAILPFTGIGLGISNVNLANVVLLDSSLAEIPAGLAGGGVTVSPSAAVPEPSTGFLVICDLAVILVLGIVTGSQQQNGWRGLGGVLQWPFRSTGRG